MSGFGDFIGTKQGQGVAGAATGILDSIGGQNKTNEEFFNRNRSLATQIGNVDKISAGLSKGAMASGNPIAMAVGAGLMVGDKFTKGGTDQFGINKDDFGSKFKRGVGMVLNPITGVNSMLNQDELQGSKDRFINNNVQTSIAENKSIGNSISNSIPKYTAPAYGRSGMKLKSKFSK